MSKAQGQFTIIDYNDALTLTGYIGSNLAKTQMYNPDKRWPLRKFCVSVFRQNQEYHIINVHDWGLFPLATAFPGGWDGMRAGTA